MIGRGREQRSGFFLQQIMSSSLHLGVLDLIAESLKIDFSDNESELTLQLLMKMIPRNNRHLRQGS
jgi:hypothetical protein